MDCTATSQRLSETRLISRLSNMRHLVFCLGNCSGHSRTPGLDKAADAINTEIRYFPPNATLFL